MTQTSVDLTSCSGLPEPPPETHPMFSADTLTDSTVVITGGGTGLGLAMGKAFSRVGARVVVASRGQDHIDRGVSELEKIGARAMGVPMDVRDHETIAAGFDAIESSFGTVDILINNAAGNFPVDARKISPNGWRAVTDIVLNGSFMMSQEFTNRLAPTARPGAILNILAAYIDGGAPAHSHSAAAKAGVANLTKSLAAEWAPLGIRVNGLSPGLFPHADHTSNMRSNRPDGYEAEWTRIPALRTGRTQELAWAAVYMCSPFASFLTGDVLTIDGGERLRRSVRSPEVLLIDEIVPPRELPST